MKAQCTKKKRGTGALKELMELAGAIDQFAYEYDTYEYMDQVDDSEEHVLSIMNDLKKGNSEKLASYFKSIVEEHKAFVKRAEDILAQIEGFASGQETALESGDADSGSGEDSHSGSAVIDGNNEGINNLGTNNDGNSNVGDGNTGDFNTGNENAGDGNTGNCNTGNNNVGSGNSGDSNEGGFNAGTDNTGDRNTGDRNEGDKNTGYGNRGSGNSGDFNATDRSAGCLCTEEPKMMMFNRPSEWTWQDWMESDAKKAVMHFAKTGDWNALKQDDRNAILSMPNFDREIFEKATGIAVFQHA